MDLQLTNRVILVVGGTGFIGSAIAERARAEGATVVVASRHPGDGIELDATDQASVDAGIARVLAEHGRLDGLVVSAAPPAHTLDPTRMSDPDNVMDAVNAKAMVFLRLANAAIPGMLAAGFGRIVGISGQNAYLSGNLTGAIRNGALNSAAKSLADQVAGTGVAINTVNPGFVTEQPSVEVEAGRPGESSPEQIAALVAFLLSPLAAAVSGENISIGHKMRGINLP